MKALCFIDNLTNKVFYFPYQGPKTQAKINKFADEYYAYVISRGIDHNKKLVRTIISKQVKDVFRLLVITDRKNLIVKTDGVSKTYLNGDGVVIFKR